MKIAVISDIHSNIIGLNLALKDSLTKKVDKYIFLGDYITDGFNDNEVLELVAKNADYAVKGNRENYILNISKNDIKINGYKNMKPLYYTLANLKEKNLEYINNLDEKLIIDLEGKKILLMHGEKITYKNNRLYFKTLDKLIDGNDFDICLFGHIHQSIDVYYKNKRFICPGSIGLPNYKSFYQYALIEIIDKKIDVKIVSFDVKETYDELYSSYIKTDYYKENPEWCELILKGIYNNKNYCGRFIKKMNKDIKRLHINNSDDYNRHWKKKYKEFQKRMN